MARGSEVGVDGHRQNRNATSGVTVIGVYLRERCAYFAGNKYIMLMLEVIGLVIGAGIGNVIVVTTQYAKDLGPLITLFCCIYCLCVAIIFSIIFSAIHTKNAKKGTYGMLVELLGSPRVAAFFVCMIPFGWVAGALFIAQNAMGTIESSFVETGAPILCVAFSIFIFFDRKLLSLFNAGTSLLELSRFVFIIVSVFVAISGATDKPSLPSGESEPKSLVDAILIVIFAASGFETSLSLAVDVPNPKQDIPRSMVAVALIAGVLYVIMNAACVELFGAEGTARLSGTTILPELSKTTLGLPNSFSVFLQVSALSNGVSASLLYSTNMVEGLAEAGHLPTFLGRSAVRGYSPAALLAGGVAVTMSRLSFADKISDLAVLCSLLLYTVTPLAGAVSFYRKSRNFSKGAPICVASAGCCCTAAEPQRRMLQYAVLCAVIGIISAALLVYAAIKLTNVLLAAGVIAAGSIVLTWRRWPARSSGLTNSTYVGVQVGGHSGYAAPEDNDDEVALGEGGGDISSAADGDDGSEDCAELGRESDFESGQAEGSWVSEGQEPLLDGGSKSKLKSGLIFGAPSTSGISGVVV